MARMKRFLPTLIVMAVLLAACGSNGSSAAATSSPRLASSASPSIAAPSASSASTASQTETAWGRIWDTLPTGFPAIAGATPTEAADDPETATFVVQGDQAKSIATFMQSSLEDAGFRTDGLSGPLEDGGYVLDAVGQPAGCMVQVTAAPLGSVTNVSILYGAICPHD
jgi:ABC-type Fe3+-hydroxamate transport system substrate-binding protein